MSGTVTEAKVLIVDSSIVERRKLVHAIAQSGILAKVTEAQSVNEGRRLVQEEDFDLCFIGVGLSEDTQIDLVAMAAQNSFNKKCALVPIARRTDRDKVYRYIKSGAHGVLLTPIQPEPLRHVVETAFLNVPEATAGAADTPEVSMSNSDSESGGTKEQITNLPWILDSVADRLSAIAQRLKNEEVAGESLLSDPKAVKEALLTAFSDISDDPDVLVAQLLALLAEQKKNQPG